MRQKRKGRSIMRVRKIIRENKSQETDTGWRDSDLTPRHAPIFPRTIPIRAGWKWRSAKVMGNAGEFILLAKCNERRDNWQAVLMMLLPDGTASAVGRLEYHGSHPGLHAHADCRRGGIESGALSLDDLCRVPVANAYHRRTHAWTNGSFWQTAKRFFKVREKTGLLL